MSRSIEFDYTLERGSAALDLTISATTTGYDNSDVGCGDADEIDEWEHDGPDSLSLTDAEEELVLEACYEALSD